MLSLSLIYCFWVKMLTCFHTNLKLHPTEEDVDGDDVLVEDAEVIFLL